MIKSVFKTVFALVGLVAIVLFTYLVGFIHGAFAAFKSNATQQAINDNDKSK